MPALGLHMTIARHIAGDLGSSVVDAERGAYYLGATTPDIRVLTRWDRERTHFFKLDEFHEQSGVHRLLEEEPALANGAALDAPTASFMAGYISHLVLDEDYIVRIYRPLFGERSELRDDALSDVLDKMLQWDIDRAEREDAPTCDEIRRSLAECAVEISVGFIEPETLREWRGVALDVMSQPATVERLVRFLQRRMPEGALGGEAEAERFVEQVPLLLGRAWQHVGTERVNEYLHDAQARARTAIKEYLS